jgi:fibronectin-binding autotransporter adhesin
MIVSGSRGKNLQFGGTGTGISTFAGAFGNHPSPTAPGTIPNAVRKTANGNTLTLASVEGIEVGATITGSILPADTTITAVNPLTRVVTLSNGYTGGNNSNFNVGVIFTIPGVINSNSVTKVGSGTWILSGDNSYTGPTAIDAGTLIINGNQSAATGPVAVNGTSTLGGSGTIGGSVIAAAGARIAPGTSAGTLTVNGGLDLSAMAGGAGTLNFELGPIAASDRIAVGGTLNIGSGTLGLSDFVFTDLGGLQAGTYKLITSGAAISGTLNEADLTGTIGAFDVTLKITGSDLELVVGGAPGGFAAWQTANSTAGGLGDDHDNDGVDNGTEYFLGGTADTTGFTPLPGVVNSGGTLTVTWAKAASYTGTYGTDFVVETSATLAAGSWIPEASPGTVTITGNDVTYTFPNPLGTKNFVRLKVTE